MGQIAGVGEGPKVRPISTRTAPEQVSKEIRRAILAGDLKPGQAFSLRGIAEQLGVSFIPVRESLRQLEAQGLVVIRPGKSAMVAPLSHADLHAVYRLRQRIEPEIAGRASKLLSPDDVARAEGYLAIFADDSLGIDDVYEAHHAFHRELLLPAATEWDLRVLNDLWLAAERYVRLAFAQRDTDPGEPHRRWQSHRDLLTATLTRDARTVAAAMRQHLDDNEKVALRALDPIAS